MFGIFDIYLLEALLNGVLLGGVLALLALGLNLIFGVIDVVWICYAELIMLGMYAACSSCSRYTTSLTCSPRSSVSRVWACWGFCCMCW